MKTRIFKVTIRAVRSYDKLKITTDDIADILTNGHDWGQKHIADITVEEVPVGKEVSVA